MGVKIQYRELEEKREECGIIAIFSKKGKNVAPLLYRSLFALQHRGQDAAGFAIFDGTDLQVRRGIGLVDQIFKKEDLELSGKMGIGHTRYPTIGECRMCDVQPTTVGRAATAHNGHIANYGILRKAIEKTGYEFVSTNDSEVIAHILDSEKEIETAVRKMMNAAQGAYCDVAIIEDKLVIFRDPLAIRPLVWGENDEYIALASETVALDVNGIPYKGEVMGGELVVIDSKGKTTRTRIIEKEPRHCMFEYVYFSRPDSQINKRSVYAVRRQLGENLAKEAPLKADVVVAVPDTSRTAAARFAEVLNIPFEEGLIKNRYIGRTFIMPSQTKRVEAVKLKLNPVKEIIEGKRVVLVDDSIVRGTTLKEIVRIVREAGAKEVHVRITCPPVKAPCFYGVDMSTYSELIASRKTVSEIGKFLGADSLAYLSIEGLERAINLNICTGCLNEKYHTEFVQKLAQEIKEKDKIKN
ncbi:amidophosphoribosyltransferase [Candidatus Micrarchaeota archaeon]|nr:amidophosphoribosyltransferase [Candidatus Micrarchaeota archaeon]